MSSDLSDRARVIHIVPAAPFGGIQTLVPALVAEQRRLGTDARLVLLGDNDAVRRVVRDHALEDATRFLNGRRAIVSLLALLLRGRQGIVHGHCEPVWATVPIALVRPRRWMVHEHLYPDDRVTWRKRTSLAVQRLGASCHIAISHSVARSVVAAGVPSGRVVTVYNGVALPALPAPAGGDGPLRIGFVGRMVPEKGIDEFVELVAMLSSDPGFTFAAFGDGPARSTAQALAAERGVADRIVFHGHVADAEAIWSSLDLVVAFSRREPFGLVLLEAAGRGVAVLTYRNDSGGSEVADRLAGATLVAPGDLAAAVDAVRRLAADRATLDDAVRRDRALISRAFSLSAMARAIADAYARCGRAGHPDGKGSAAK